MNIKTLTETEYDTLCELLAARTAAQRDLDWYKHQCRKGIYNHSLADKIAKQSAYRESIRNLTTQIEEITK